MGLSRIEQLIEDIYEFVESCKMSPLSSTKVVVPKDQLYDLLDELRLRTPDEIKRYQKIIANRDAIIADAEDKAATMLADAQEKTKNLISEHEIMQQAYAQANQVLEQANNEARQILASANADADQIRSGALSYTEEILSTAEKLLADSFEAIKARNNSLLTALEDNLNIVRSNKKEITDQLYGAESSVAADIEEGQPEEEDDFYLDEDAFLKNID
jgi:hypothetical protein